MALRDSEIGLLPAEIGKRARSYLAVEHLAKVGVGGSSPVARSSKVLVRVTFSAATDYRTGPQELGFWSTLVHMAIFTKFLVLLIYRLPQLPAIVQLRECVVRLGWPRR